MTTDRAELAMRLDETEMETDITGSMQQEIARLTSALSQREAEIDVLKEALKPFDEALNEIETSEPDQAPLYAWRGPEDDPELHELDATVGDLRRARALRTSSETGGAWVKVVEAAHQVVASGTCGSGSGEENKYGLHIVGLEAFNELKDALSALNRSEAG